MRPGRGRKYCHQCTCWRNTVQCPTSRRQRSPVRGRWLLATIGGGSCHRLATCIRRRQALHCLELTSGHILRSTHAQHGLHVINVYWRRRSESVFIMHAMEGLLGNTNLDVVVVFFVVFLFVGATPQTIPRSRRIWPGSATCGTLAETRTTRGRTGYWQCEVACGLRRSWRRPRLALWDWRTCSRTRCPRQQCPDRSHSWHGTHTRRSTS